MAQFPYCRGQAMAERVGDGVDSADAQVLPSQERAHGRTTVAMNLMNVAKADARIEGHLKLFYRSPPWLAADN